MFSYSNLWSGYGPFNWGIVAELANLSNLKDAMPLSFWSELLTSYILTIFKQ